MKILMLASYLPYPLWDGGRIRLYNILKTLSKNHEVTLICEKRPKQSEKDIREVGKICKKLIVVERPDVWSLRNLAKTAFSLNPLLVTSHSSKKIKEAIEGELNAEKFDLIHVETFYIMENLPEVDIPIVLTEHNIEYEIYAKYTKKAKFFAKPVLFADVAKLKRLEKNFWKRADKLIAVSAKEQKIMGAGTQLVPNGVDIEKFKFKKLEKNKKVRKILFIGDFKWIQNRDSAFFIIKNIWPRIINETKDKFDLKLWIVGKNIPESIKKLKNETITFDENAPDQTELIFEDSDILLSPIRVGGGSNFKILEAMASGVPVVTSRLGNEGLGAQENSEIIICDLPEECVQAVLKLLNDDYYFEKIARRGREFVEKNFDWKIISKKLEEVYKSVVK
ncbi:MAG: hypothetical protein A3A51_00860 [Candidatus Levybacteria bacterium RIFCSPLOWO2_01_FULL_39_10]|nr:MAG: hypothetical protein A3A51_00860 [Candidatus Levybacteria bacterium RIFCSPLOWO2_01_FULL_39_10]